VNVAAATFPQWDTKSADLSSDALSESRACRRKKGPRVVEVATPRPTNRGPSRTLQISSAGVYMPFGVKHELGSSNVVDADAVAEDRPRVRVRLLDRRAGEAHEARLRQGVAHVAGEAVDEVVLAAVGLVGDDDDVASVRQHGVAVARLGRHELLDGREDDATAGDAELLAQAGPLGGLDGTLAQQVVAAGEGTEELAVQVALIS
jgi:hypothetical protein